MSNRKSPASKLVPLVILLVLGALISSCVTSPQAPEAVEMVPQITGKVFAQSNRSLRIYPVTGAVVEPGSTWKVPVPGIDNERFQQTLIATLQKSNMFSAVSTGIQADYGLTAKVLGQQMTPGLANVMTLLVRYTFVETATGNVLWQENVLSQHTESVSDVFLGTERSRLALQRGVQKNLALLLEKLNKVVVLPAGEAITPAVPAPAPEIVVESEPPVIVQSEKQPASIPRPIIGKAFSIAVLTSAGNLIDDHHFERVMSDQQLGSYMADTVEESLRGLLPVNTTYTKVVNRDRTRAIVYEGDGHEESKRACAQYSADKVVATMFSRMNIVGSAEIHLYDCAKGWKKVELVDLDTHYGEKYYMERDFGKALNKFYEDNPELLNRSAENGDHIKEPLLNVVLPSKRGISEYYYVQPVNISLTNMDKSDGIAALRLDVISNLPAHQHVFSASFAAPARVIEIGTRLRLEGKGEAVVKAVAQTQSGQEITATGKIQLDEGVNFSNESSLTKRLPMNVKMLQGPIGTARVRLWEKGKYDRQCSAIIYHPMLPRIGEQGPDRLESLKIEYRGTLLGQIEFGDAISNDPYIDILFKDQQPGSGPIRVQWKDNAGRAFEPEKVDVK